MSVKMLWCKTLNLPKSKKSRTARLKGPTFGVGNLGAWNHQPLLKGCVTFTGVTRRGLEFPFELVPGPNGGPRNMYWPRVCLKKSRKFVKTPCVFLRESYPTILVFGMYRIVPYPWIIMWILQDWLIVLKRAWIIEGKAFDKCYPPWKRMVRIRLGV